MSNPSAYLRRDANSPAEHAFSITTHNTNDLPFVTRFIYVGGAGDVRVETTNGESVTFKAVPAGTVLPIRAKAVRTTLTTATDLVGLY